MTKRYTQLQPSEASGALYVCSLIFINTMKQYLFIKFIIWDAVALPPFAWAEQKHPPPPNLRAGCNLPYGGNDFNAAQRPLP
jgi:hypothetical protein